MANFPIDRRTAARSLGMGVLGAALAPSIGVAAPLGPNSGIASSVVTAAAEIIRKEYVDPVKAASIADLLLTNLRRGAYAAVTSPADLAGKLTNDLRAATNDLHMHVSYDPAVPAAAEAREATEDNLHPRTTGFGIQTAARLEGNIGLLRVTHFPSPPRPFASRYAAAMELVQTTSALILDLTLNHGGGTDTYGFFLSYFLDGEIELGRIDWRNSPVEIIKTTNAVPGLRYGQDRPLYVAISQSTFSAGEAIAFQLKARGRATLIGRPTRGGAHAGNFFKLPNDFRIFVVMGRQQGPDWEGSGVAPDIPADSEFAVRVAHRLAVENLMAKSSNPALVQILRNVLDHSIENLSSFPY